MRAGGTVGGVELAGWPAPEVPDGSSPATCRLCLGASSCPTQPAAAAVLSWVAASPSSTQVQEGANRHDDLASCWVGFSSVEQTSALPHALVNGAVAVAGVRSCVPAQPAVHAPPAREAAAGSSAACQGGAPTSQAACSALAHAHAAESEPALGSGAPVEGSAVMSHPYCAHASACAALGKPLLTSPLGVLDSVVEHASEPAAAVPPELGSADPHGLRLDDDRAAGCSRQPTFNVRAHSAAGRDELCGRPLPQLNRAEATTPKPPPAASAKPSPRFTRVEQVVAHAVYRAAVDEAATAVLAGS